MEKKQTLLWLDDVRDPYEHDWLIFSPILPPFDVFWARSYEDFVKFITRNGLPDAICFDHDLGGDVQREKVSKGMSKRQARLERQGTKTGMDCAKWLVEYCLDKKMPLPRYNIQSANPAGKANIDGLLQSFLQHQSHD